METKKIKAEDILVATFNSDPFYAGDYPEDINAALGKTKPIAHTAKDMNEWEWEVMAAKLDLAPAEVSVIYECGDMTFALLSDCNIED